MGGVIAGLLARAEAALNYEPGRGRVYRAHAGLKLLALALSWAALLGAWSPWEALAAISYPVLLAVLAGRRILPGAQVSLLPASFIGLASLLISPYEYLTAEWAWRALVLALRIYGLALVSLATFTTIHPLALASLASRIPFLHDFIIVYYRGVPLAVQDLEWAYMVQRLHGHGVRDALTAATLAAVERSRRLELSLAARGMDRGGPRTPIMEPGDPVSGSVLAGVSLATLLAVLLV